MMLTKGELFSKLGELLDDSDIRFSFAGEEMEVERIDMEAEMDESWIVLYPKAEDPDPSGYYIGRHRKTED
jgi:hypothetical protein